MTLDVYYLCQTGKYAALLAGAFHLQILKPNLSFKCYRSYVEDNDIELFSPYFLGEDETGKRVYIVATDTEQKLIATIIKSFNTTFAKDKNIVIVDSLPKPNILLFAILKLNSLFFLKPFFQRLIPFAVWLNRHKIYASSLHIWERTTKA